MTVAQLIEVLATVPQDQLVMLALPNEGPHECEAVLQMRRDGIECIGLFDATHWNLDR